jgi:hypothetical protein
MKSVAVESTTLTHVAYDSDRQVLELEFRDRRIYQYCGVPPEVHDALLQATSKGHYFNRYIRGRYAFSRNASSALSHFLS